MSDPSAKSSLPPGPGVTPDLPYWADEPPPPPDGQLVPGSTFHEERWVMAAAMLARGASFLNVSRAMGCSRTTLWRAYYNAPAFRSRVWWEREALNRESHLRLASLRGLLVEQVERLVSAGDPATVRWLVDRMGMLSEPGKGPLAAGDDDPSARRERDPPEPKDIAAIIAAPEAEGPKGLYPYTVLQENLYPNLGSAREREGARPNLPRRGQRG